MSRQDHRIELLQKSHRGFVNVASFLVGHILALIARIIQIEHRGNRIDANAVDVVNVKEKHRAGNQKTDHLGTAIVEDQRAPLGMMALHWIFMFIKTGPVKTGKAVRILGKMGRHPIHDHTDSFGMHRIDKIHQILRRAITARHRVKAGDLITP